MKPTTQTRFGHPEGNCYAACLASIFEKDLAGIELPKPPTEEATRALLASWGYELVVTPASEPPPPNVWHIAIGLSPRGNFWHAVVAKNGKVEFDPHPDRTGIGKPQEWHYFRRISR